jgi:hypothetical protein
VAATALALALLVRLPLLPLSNHVGDLDVHKAWATSLANRGAEGFYASDEWIVPPGYLYLAAGSVLGARLLSWGAPLPETALNAAVKMPAVVADLLTAGVLYLWLRRARGPRAGLLALLCTAFAPAAIYLSAWWGQFDSLLALFVVASLLALPSSDVRWSWRWLAVAFAVKPQAVVAAPIVALATWRHHGGKGLFSGGVAALATWVLLALPFLLDGQLRGVLNIYLGAVGHAPFVHMNAMNLWFLVSGPGGSTIDDTGTLLAVAGLPPRTVGLGVLMASAAAVLAVLWRRRGGSAGSPVDVPSYALAAAALYAAFFAYPTQIHERYLFPMFPLLACALYRHATLIPLYLLLAIAFFVNLVAVGAWPASFKAAADALPVVYRGVAWLVVLTPAALLAVLLAVLAHPQPSRLPD